MKADELILRAIKDYAMIAADESILVGFSGGADSVCLLSVLHSMGYNVTAAHLNHNMRDTAERDLQFCKRFCEVRGIPFVSRTADKGSLKNEAEAREARYAFFYEIMRERGIDLLATAHNKNDSAETVLLHMLRGASTDGLCGISPRDGKLIRPMLFVKKSVVFHYCEQNGLEYVTDETNLSDIYTRNKLRNRFLPELENEFNPRIVDSIAENALLTAQDSDYLSKCAEAAFEESKSKNGVDIKKLTAMHSAISARVVQLLWKKVSASGQNLAHRYIESILTLARKGRSGSRADLPCNFAARIEYGVLSIEKKEDKEEFCEKLKIGEWCILPYAKVGIFESGSGLGISLNGYESLEVRTRRSGDRFTPSGMTGSKSLSDYFTDIKLEHIQRCRMPVFTADGKILAVGALRADDAFAKGRLKRDYYIKIESI